MKTYSISFETLLMIYAGIKLAISFWVCKHEFQYPIWDKGGIQISRGIHHKAQSFLRNWAINPEWGLLKIIAFLPVFIATGRRFIHAFLPWRVQKTPPFCKKCNDKGKVLSTAGGFFIGGDSKWQECDCKKLPKELPDCKCHVCLDQGHIGKGRPCPHCQRATSAVKYFQMSTCDKCGEKFPQNESAYRWCKECYIKAGSTIFRGKSNPKKCRCCGEEYIIGYSGYSAAKQQYTEYCSLWCKNKAERNT